MTQSPDDAVRDQAVLLARAPSEHVREAEGALLRLLGESMRREDACFDPEHGFARILNASASHHEVRLGIDGAWKIGAGREEDLVATWGAPGRPSLREILDAIPRAFASARIGRLVDEVREVLASRHAAATTLR